MTKMTGDMDRCIHQDTDTHITYRIAHDTYAHTHIPYAIFEFESESELISISFPFPFHDLSYPTLQ
jgi:hypothetical protein